MIAREYSMTVHEGQMIPLVAKVLGPDGTWLKQSTTGQQGATNVDITVYDRSSSSSPQTSIYSATLATSDCFPSSGIAVGGPGITGDGWSDDPEGYNFLRLLAAGLFPMSGGQALRIVVRVHMTGTTGGVAWGDATLVVNVTVLALETT